MRSLRALLLCSVLLPSAFACKSDELPLPSCPVGTQLADGRCLPQCGDAVECLLTEQCVEGVCTPASFERPTVLAFEAWPMVVDRPGQVEVRYLVQGADKVELFRRADGQGEQLITTETGAPEAGQETVARILEDTTLVIEAWRGDEYLDSAELTVVVRGDPSALSIDRFEVDRDTVTPGEAVTVSWQTTNATEVSVEVDGRLYADGLPLTGSKQVEIQQSTELTLIARNADDEVDKSLYVQVVEGGEAILHAAQINPSPMQEGDNAVISWSAEGTEQIVLSEGASAFYETRHPELVREGRWLLMPEPGAHAYSVRAVGAPPATKSVGLNVRARPAPPTFQDARVTPVLVSPSQEAAPVTVQWEVVPNTAEVTVSFDDGQTHTARGSGQFTTSVRAEQSTAVTILAETNGGAARRHLWVLTLDEEDEPNDLRGAATPATNLAREGVIGRVGTSLDVDWYSLTAFDGARLAAAIHTAQGCPSGVRLELYASGGNNPLDGAQTSAGGDCPELLVPDLDPGDYLLKLSKPLNTPDVEYTLVSALLPPECGDGVTSPGEQCDDGNLAVGDYCAPDCRVASTHLYSVRSSMDAPAAVPPEPELARWTPYTEGFSAEDEGVTIFELPFEFPFFGRTFRGVAVFTNGYVSFLPWGGGGFNPGQLYGPGFPNAVVAPFAANLDVEEGTVAAWVDEASNEGPRFVIGFENVRFAEVPRHTVSGQVHLYPDGRVGVFYGDLPREADAQFFGFFEGPEGVVQGTLPGCDDSGCNGGVLAGRRLEILPTVSAGN